MAGCSGERVTESSRMVVDLNVSPREKEIQLEDIADVDYLQLELDDEFIFSGVPSIITEDKVVISQFSGEILVFSRAGKPLSKFNHRGNGPEDYPSLYGLVYDEHADELFIISDKSIIVYSIKGEFRRRLHMPEGARISEIVDFDAHSLLLYDDYNVYPSPFTFISKESGAVVDTVSLPRDKKIDVRIVRQDENNVSIVQGPMRHIVRHDDGYLLTNYSIDTVYFLSGDKQTSPTLVRKPDIQSMNPAVYLNSYILAGNMAFMLAVTVKDENGRLPRTWLMYEHTTGLLYQPRITLKEYDGKEVNLSVETITATSDSKLGLIVLSLDELQEAYGENRLRGELKRMVEHSEDDGNDIYMLLRFK
jgi:hypothetical protein